MLFLYRIIAWVKKVCSVEFVSERQLLEEQDELRRMRRREKELAEEAQREAEELKRRQKEEERRKFLASLPAQLEEKVRWAQSLDMATIMQEANVTRERAEEVLGYPSLWIELGTLKENTPLPVVWDYVTKLGDHSLTENSDQWKWVEGYISCGGWASSPENFAAFKNIREFAEVAGAYKPWVVLLWKVTLENLLQGMLDALSASLKKAESVDELLIGYRSLPDEYPDFGYGKMKAKEIRELRVWISLDMGRSLHQAIQKADTVPEVEAIVIPEGLCNWRGEKDASTNSLLQRKKERIAAIRDQEEQERIRKAAESL